MTKPPIPRHSLSLLTIVAVALLTALPARAQSGDGKAADPLATLNELFRTEYAAARKATLAASGPIVVVQFDDLVLFHDGKSKRAGFTPAIYHEVKAIAHFPLTLYVTLARRAGKPLDDAAVAVLADLRGRAVAAERSLAGRPGWTAAVLANNRRIVAGSLELIDATVAARTIAGATLQAYARRMRPLLLENAHYAAKAQLDGLDALVTAWRREMGEAQWRRAYVVVLAPRQARPGSLQYAYFRRLMGARAEGVRLFYAENVFAADGGANLLGTILLDRRASVAFFVNPLRLERDLLADAAVHYLQRMKLNPLNPAPVRAPAEKK